MTLPLHVACSTGKRNAVKKIIESVPLHDLEAKDETGKTPLMLSVMHNQIETASLLLKAGVHVDNSDSSGQTALHIATNKGFHRCVKLLLSYNASSQQKDFFGVTPLHLAAVHANAKCLLAILKEIKPGAIDIQDSSKKTPLHWCTAYANIESTKILLMKDANICIPDEEGKTPLHWASTNSSANSLECIKILLEKESSLINWQDYGGRSALHLAVATGSTDVVRFLVSRDDCNIEILDNTFCTPLHWAAVKGFYDKVDILLSGRACCTSADDNGATALHYAAYSNHAKTVEVFLSRNYVCIDAEDASGRNAVIWSAAQNADDVINIMALNGVNLLFADKNGITALHAAALQGHEATTVGLLKNFQVPVDLKDKYGMTPLLRACEFGRSKTAMLLINHGANIYEKDMKKRSTLHWCALSGHAYLCQILLLKGVECNCVDAYGMTPLHYACMGNGYLNCVSILLEAKAKPNVVDIELMYQYMRNRELQQRSTEYSGSDLDTVLTKLLSKGKTPLHWAVSSDNKAVVKLLCEYDADVNAMAQIQNYWRSPLDLAVLNDNLEMVKLLRHYGALSIKEIEEVAAFKIQVWYLSKSGKHHPQKKKHFCGYENAQKRNFELSSNTALLKRCQHVIEAFNMPSFTNEQYLEVSQPSKVSLPIQKSHETNDMWLKYQVTSLKNVNYSSFKSNQCEARAAFIIQRAWRKYLLKSRFMKMRKTIKRAFKTPEDRYSAERLWQIKLFSFCKQF